MVSSELDTKSKQILEALYNHGGEAETSEIKQYTGIEKNGIIHYRINEKLLPKGLVEARKVDDEESQLGVKITTLTEKGENVVGEVIDEQDGVSLVDKMDALRSEVEELRETVFNYEGKLLEGKEQAAEAYETAAEMERALQRHEEIEQQFEEVKETAEFAARKAEQIDDIEAGLREAVEALVEANVIEKRETGKYKIHPDLYRFKQLSQAGVFGAMCEDVEETDIIGLNTDLGHPPTVDAVEEQDAVRVPEVPADSGSDHSDPREVIDPRPTVTKETAEKLNELTEMGAFDSLLETLDDVEVGEDSELRVSVDVVERPGEDVLEAEKARWYIMERLDPHTTSGEPEPPVDRTQWETVKDIEQALTRRNINTPYPVMIELAEELGLDTLGWEERHGDADAYALGEPDTGFEGFDEEEI